VTRDTASPPRAHAVRPSPPPTRPPLPARRFQARDLKKAGLTAYNHNLDTSREHYPNVITTRSYDDRLQTIANVRKAGISVCCGGILGLGESEDDRIGCAKASGAAGGCAALYRRMCHSMLWPARGLPSPSDRLNLRLVAQAAARALHDA